MKAHHIGIYVKDLKETELFYEKWFGYKVQHRLTLKGEEVSFLKNKTDLVQLELIKSNDVNPIEGTIHLAFEVSQWEQTIKKFEKEGVYPIEGPLSLHNDWKIVFYQGPNNEIIELLKT